MSERENVVMGDSGDNDELVCVGTVDNEISVLETIEKAERMFGMQEQINTHIYLSSDLVRYIRVVSLIVNESETVIVRGMVSYGKTKLYKCLYDDIKRMRGYEVALIVKNRFVRESVMEGIPSPVQFNKRERIGIRLVDGIYGALLHIADEMHLDRTYIAELAMWTSFKDLFEQDKTINEMLKGDNRFIDNLRIFDTLKTTINGLCDDYEGVM